MGRALTCLLLTVALSGCEAWDGTAKSLRPLTPGAITYVLVDGITLINTHKTIEDHVISLITGMDCSVVRASQGDHYCLEKDNTPVYLRTSYCYKSIAKVSCYDQPMVTDVGQLYGIRIERVPVTTTANAQ
jgi:hypothetical protein